MAKVYPIIIEKDSQYQNKLVNELDTFVDWVEKHHPVCLEKVGNIVNCIKDAVESYYKSNFLHAIKLIEKIVQENNLASCSANDIGNDEYSMSLFKSRTIAPTESISHECMLHIPFDIRNIVASQRFSLNGTPCIYLAKSSYACWLELNSPEDNKFFVSAFDLPETIKFLDLTCLTWDKLENFTAIDGDVEEKLCTFPLIIATSFKVKENNSTPFHSEYIVSELLMSIVATSNKWDGVAYYSKKFSDEKKFYPINVCFALLAKFCNKKYTKDIDLLRWTDPVSLGEFSHVRWDIRGNYTSISGGGASDEKHIKQPVILISDNISYSSTILHEFDEWIKKNKPYKNGKNIDLNNEDECLK